MVKVSKGLLIVLLGLLLSQVLLACSGAGPETPPWLLGRWQVAYNPNQDDNDDLLFQQGSKVSIETEDGRTFQGLYQIQQDQLVMYIEVGRRSVETRVRISAAQDRLIFSNGAYYMKEAYMKAADDQEDEASQ